ncbi:MAG TPA: histidine kinase N-terminal 7TM domain-containing protein [Actinomycetes bacterium]
MGRHWLFSALALGGGACLGVYTYYVWRRRRASAGVSLAVALAAAGWWGLAYAIELAETRLPARLLWGDLKWLGVAVLPPAWFAFIMQFTGHGRWVNRRTMAALAVPPAAVLALLAVPATHDLVRYYPASAAADPADAIAQVGWAFWPFLAYADAIFWSTTALFVWTLTRLSRLYWRQSLLLIATVLLPFLANILHNLNVGPFARVELTPFLFVLTGAVLVWGIFRFRLLDLAPIARGKIFELMHDAVVVLDPYGRVVDANLEAARLIGEPVTQAVGQPLEQLLPAFGSTTTPAWTAAGLRRDEASMGGRDYELTISALPDQWGRPTGALLIARDVSERRRAERHVRESLARERAATERLTVALEREQAATERLRALDEMKDAFLQAVSHDLRTPLTSVLGLALTLRRGHQALPAAEVGDLLGRLEGNARKLDRLLTNLLDLDRLTRGALTLERRRVDLGELVGGIVKEAEAELLGERPVSLETSPVLVAVDPAKVERIVENLLANAARHTREGTPVWVRVEARDEGGLVVVEDAGPGVPAEARQTIFEPFQQGPSITAHAPGSGIGLALVAYFAGMHGGRAWVEDRPGGGSSFQVLLPDATEHDLAAL